MRDPWVQVCRQSSLPFGTPPCSSTAALGGAQFSSSMPPAAEAMTCLWTGAWSVFQALRLDAAYERQHPGLAIGGRLDPEVTCGSSGHDADDGEQAPRHG